jgi:MFS transporter, putative metabolite:H+ symporter
MNTTALEMNLSKRLDRMPVTRFHVLFLLLCGLGTLFDAMDSVLIASAIPVLRGSLKLSVTQVTLIGTIGTLGLFLGALVVGGLADKYGRKAIFQLSLIWFSLFSLLCAFSVDFWSFAIFRFIQGIGLGAEVPIVASYAAEFVPAKKRGALMSLYQSCFILGIILASLLGWLIVPRWGWRVLMGIGAVPVLLSIWLRRDLPESPRWLLAKGRIDEATAVVEKIEKSAKGNIEAIPIEPEPSVIRQAPVAAKQGLFTGRPSTTIMLWVIWFVCFASSYGLTTWRPAIFSAAGVPLSRALFWTFVTTLVGIPGFLLAAWLLDKIGRKGVGVGVFAVSVIANFMFGESGKQLVPLVVWALVLQCSNGITQALVYTWTPELYPTNIRARGTSVASSVGRAGQYIIPTVIGGFVLAGSMTAGYGIISGLCIIAILVIVLFGVETKKLSLEALHGQRPGQ